MRQTGLGEVMGTLCQESREKKLGRGVDKWAWCMANNITAPELPLVASGSNARVCMFCEIDGCGWLPTVYGCHIEQGQSPRPLITAHCFIHSVHLHIHKLCYPFIHTVSQSVTQLFINAHIGYNKQQGRPQALVTSLSLYSLT